MRVGILPWLKFPNGTYIFNSEGKQLDPRVGEGKVVREILERQEKTRKENQKQKRKVETLIDRDLDGDGIIGEPNDPSKRDYTAERKSKKKSKSKNKLK